MLQYLATGSARLCAPINGKDERERERREERERERGEMI
jgi:hypothetical protein